MLSLAAAAACADLTDDYGVAQQAVWPTQHISVWLDGTFHPADVTVHVGQSVAWDFMNPTDAVVPASSAPYPAICDPANRMPWTGAANDLTGPMPRNASGTFVVAPDEAGYQYMYAATTPPNLCPNGMPGASFDPMKPDTGPWLCKTGPYQSTLDASIAHTGVTGVFVRLKWSDLNPAQGVYDWTVLERELDKIVAPPSHFAAKLYSLAVKAGASGTPDWIFSTEKCVDPGPPADPCEQAPTRPVPGQARNSGGGGVRRLYLDWNESSDSAPARWASFGSPVDPMYQQRYNEMLSAVAARIKQRADWYRGLAYIKPSGANHQSAENRLPNGCKQEFGVASCNAQYWAEDGYTSAGLYDFYVQLFDHIASEFPGKTMSYQLIQDGFPKVTDVPTPGLVGCWETNYQTHAIACPGGGVYGSVLFPANDYPMASPPGVGQTEHVLAGIRSAYPFDMAVQHNGLRPTATGPCPGSDGCPNRWAYDAGHIPLPAYPFGQITGYQHGSGHVVTPLQLEQSYQNLYNNSDGVFVEIFELALWRSGVGGLNALPLDPAAAPPRTLEQWTTRLHDRRRRVYPQSNVAFPDPTPTTHQVSFTVPGIYPYINAGRCGFAAGTSGVIEIIP